MKTVHVTIRRGDDKTSHLDSYAVPVEEGLSVLDLLTYIYDHLDPTLAYFSHEACHQAACGKCLVRVNGKVCLACERSVQEDTLLIEPWCEAVVRDLVCQNP